MSNWKDYCNRCVLDAVDKGKLDEEVLYHSDGRKKILKDYGPAYPVYDNHGIFVYYAKTHKLIKKIIVCTFFNIPKI